MPDDRSEKERRRLYELAGTGVEFFAALMGGLLIGYLCDRWLKTAPLGLLIGVGLGFAIGLFRLVRLSKQK